ncbi:carbohydrate ABC transporter permease [Microbacterium esteraromaticum]|uniref:Carbohydrate ABC transporter permease n=1 Tax=Microbacterium esteraromaticum TaxID=57043 RepID=A0A7D8AI40_9MICO|nr:carbohydrate ABC transporter permease [Microbacterium esteraromaticum]QMU96269.1 carbohydrate ABC transporter permease [Microbacterium esteraromaticum]
MTSTRTNTSTRRSRPQRAYVISSVLGAAIGLLFVLPLLWALISSLRPGAEVLRFLNPLQWHTFVPSALTFDNYVALLETKLGIGILNSLIVSFVTVLFGLVVCAAAAFALAAIPFRGRGAVFGIIVLSFLIPFDAIAIPLADLFRDWQLQNTYTALILPGIGNGLAIFMLRQFFLAIPKELVEAATLDGLGWFGVFRRIHLPLSVPPLIGAGLTLFLFQWQSYMWPLLIGTDTQHTVGPVALAGLEGEFSVDYGVLFAGAIVLTVIPLVIIMSLQRYFIHSVSTSGMK